MTSALPPAPETLRHPAGGLLHGSYAGQVTRDPSTFAPRHGRRRRWLYAATGTDDAAIGAAVVDLGFVIAVFAWVVVDGRTSTFDHRAPFGRGGFVGTIPGEGARARGSFGRVELGADGSLELDVPTSGGRLRAEILCRQDVLPLVLATRTPAGGWNVTEKAAGAGMDGWLTLEGRSPVDLSGAGGWRDWTCGRQDRTTSWTWVAGAGRAVDGRSVGLNLSTGMNGDGSGEDVVWWDGIPSVLSVDRLGPAVDGAPEGPWEIRGSGCALDLEVQGVRARTERLPLLRSSYTQPIGRLTGTLPAPDGSPIEVALVGVAEDHLAVW